MDRNMADAGGTVGKIAVVGAKDRETGEVAAHPVAFTDRETLHGFVTENTDPGSIVYTDEAVAYEQMPQRYHRAVKHSVGEVVRDMAHTKGIESLLGTPQTWTEWNTPSNLR